ncbi:hypothetical protein H9657_10360 [Cellulomonas sp. Sa3CUA2]|uniref:Uncharacterized protein n=1 Tax=Cellulomonas avistercoris TaxID=2762242 RepID=A0ABR8QE32_9CELL|nr:hypothetical protein [Cellulomonas avistercoris]MBD7918675.1 hypothetical protein [Cellulomonas avistercoris]
MSADQARPGIPSAPPVAARDYRDDPSTDPDAPRWYRDGDRWLRATAGGVLVLAWALTDLGPAALAAMLVVAADSTVRTRRTGTRWWTVLELALLALLLVATLVLSGIADALTGAELAVQLVAGALAGAGAAALLAALRRRRAARAARPTAV